ncbi:MAG: M14 family zinc carboxypeptidase [Planctomycetota bacterium]
MSLVPALVVVATSLLLAPPQRGGVPSPESHLGRPAASDFTLTTWDELSSYYEALAAASPNVRLEKVGTTADGRDFLLAVIGSEHNLARLGELEALAKQVADPRGLSEEERAKVLADAVPFLFVSVGMHSTECAAWDFGMEFAYRLATSDEEPYRSAREDLVIYMPPCLNPDGVDRVSQWYREHVGTPHEGTDLLELYQEFAGHDNNRDWFGLSLQETRVVTNLLYSRVFPQVYWDIHQQGSSRESFFVPPYRDPLDPNFDPGLITSIDLLGSRALFDMTKEGLTGVATGVTYDMWWNGGNRNVSARHNIVGILTEAASCNLGSPRWTPYDSLSAPSGLDSYAPSNRFPAPWPGGWWRLRDIVEYEHAFGRSLLGSLTREPRLWLENTMSAATSSIEAARTSTPRAFLIPPTDPASAQRTRLLDNLKLLGVEVQRAESEITADGRSWPKGSIVVRLDQPYGRFAKDLLEVQRYPDGSRPYDIAGWTFPALLGVDVVEIHGDFEGEMELPWSLAGAQMVFVDPLQGVEVAEGVELHDARDGTSWTRGVGALAQGRPVSLVRVAERGTNAIAIGRGPTGSDSGPEVLATRETLPRIGVYAPWSGLMNEGWLRLELHRHGVPFVRVRPEAIRAGHLADEYDVIVLPSLSARELREGRRAGSSPEPYTRGIESTGAAALEAFVRGGGTLVAMESSAEAAIELLGLPVTEVTRREENREFACPGSVLRTSAVAEDWFAPAVMFSNARAFETTGDAEVVLQYAERETLLSGWIQKPEVIAGKAYLVRCPVGSGTVWLFAARPQYRGWSDAMFLNLLRTVLF